jgi:dUTP pyrophosphatase
MKKEDIEDYIKKLERFEKEITGDEHSDDFIRDLDKLLRTLSNDIQESYTPDSTALNVKIKKLHPNAVIPSYSKDGDAGLDLVATSISNGSTTITYGTGLAIEIPKGYVGLLFPRSSIRKYELMLANSVGVIDSGYRGEIQATFRKGEDFSPKYNIGDRIAQILILPYPQIQFSEVIELSNTERGEGGFGHTGSK